MNLSQPFIAELQQEAQSTVRVFERIPEDKLGWKPHEKSMSFAEMSSHIVEMLGWVTVTLKQTELDFAQMDYKPWVASSVKELIDAHQQKLEESIEALKNATNEQMMTPWKMRNGDQVYFELPRAVVIRGTILNHLYHHRGQLTVYLRLNDLPLPGIYGPTADEKEM